MPESWGIWERFSKGYVLSKKGGRTGCSGKFSGPG